MSDTNLSERLEIFSTCPQSKDVGRDAYIQRVADVSQWSESLGCTGILVFHRRADKEIETLADHEPKLNIQPTWDSSRTTCEIYATGAWSNWVAGGNLDLKASLVISSNRVTLRGDVVWEGSKYNQKAENVIVKALTKMMRDLVS